MKKLAFIAALHSIVLVAGCGNSTPAASPPDLLCEAPAGFHSECGQPCEAGNSKGVGKFCRVPSDCFDNGPAALCTQLDPSGSSQYFCTMKCKVDGDCGEKARCACDNGQCGCYPTKCDAPVDAGAPNG